MKNWYKIAQDDYDAGDTSKHLELARQRVSRSIEFLRETRSKLMALINDPLVPKEDLGNAHGSYSKAKRIFMDNMKRFKRLRQLITKQSPEYSELLLEQHQLNPDEIDFILDTEGEDIELPNPIVEKYTGPERGLVGDITSWDFDIQDEETKWNKEMAEGLLGIRNEPIRREEF